MKVPAEKELIIGAEKAFKNAQKLFKSASQLLEVDSSTSYFLFQICIEECAKMDILGTHYTGYYYFGDPINWEKIKASIRSHKAKNFSNAYFIPMGRKERQAIKKGKTGEWSKIFSGIKSKHHQTSNELKNKSLYVDIDGTKFYSPEKYISKRKVFSIQKEAERRIRIAEPYMRVLQNYKKKSNNKKESYAEFSDRLFKKTSGKKPGTKEFLDALLDATGNSPGR